MKTLYYKVRYIAPYGRGWIDGFARAGLAKQEVERVNASTAKTGMRAEYLGDERTVTYVANQKRQVL
jgi:hypothetical protein